MAVHFVFPDLGGDAVAEGVGGVFGRQRAEVGRVGEQVGDVGPGAGELGEVRGEGGQGRVASGGGGGGGDPGLPFADARLAGLQRVVEPALGVAFGRGVLGRPGGSQVGVGGLVGGAPLLDVGDQLGVETGQVFGPPGCVGECLLSGFVGELSGELVAAGQVVLPGGVIEELGGDSGQPGEGSAGAVVGLGEVEPVVDDSGPVAGLVERPDRDRLAE